MYTVVIPLDATIMLIIRSKHSTHFLDNVRKSPFKHYNGNCKISKTTSNLKLNPWTKFADRVGSCLIVNYKT